ncbi:MAG TPA: acyltransferase family protein [Acidimicrobiia bacterium]|nr:acyltransferase family protein [Acidimicrobiia bacterium]
MGEDRIETSTDLMAAPRADTSPRASAYHPALDGLRALAVVAVIVFHFAPSVLPAGFLGVDVFFVVSGFLIARLLARELERTDRIGLGTFWARRARRLLPALGIATLVIVAVSAEKLSPFELHSLRSQALGTLFYCANWVFIAGKGSYFATLGRPSPLQHMWSLAVEEQFYVVLPLLFVLFRRFVRERPIAVAVVAVLGAIASSVRMAMLVTAHHDPSRAYWGSDSHAMGLLLGVALGVLAAQPDLWQRLSTSVRFELPNAVAFVAAIVIAVVMITASGRSYALFHGGFFLVSLAAATIVAVVVAYPVAPIAWLLRQPPLVAIGLRSYSLYLWHWPVGVFLGPTSGLHGAGLFVARVAVSAVLAEVSYRLIERPFRTGAVWRAFGVRGALAWYAACAVAVIVLVVTVAAPVSFTLSPPRFAGARRVDVFGDSTAFVFAYDGNVHAHELNVSVGGNAKLGCGTTDADAVTGGQIVPTPPDCKHWQDRWRSWMRADPDATLALMTGAWEVLDQHTAAGDARFGSAEWSRVVTSGLRDALDVLRADGRTVYVFDVPCYGHAADGTNRERSDPARIAGVNAILARLARQLPRVRLVHWRTLVCPNGHHIDQLNGHQIWQADEAHLADAGSVAVWKWWLARLPRS